MIFSLNVDYNYFDCSKINSYRGIIIDKYVTPDKAEFIISNNLKVKVIYFGEELIDLNLGDEIIVYGEMYIPKTNTNLNLFSYRSFLKSKDIFYMINADSIEKVSSNNNLLYGIKNFFIDSIQKNKMSDYLYTFILGDNRYISDEVKSSYQILGISHLFSVSGMHISIFTGIILFLLKKLNIVEEKRLLFCIFFILFYIFLVNYCPSGLRSGLFFILNVFNKIFYLNISSFNILLLVVGILIFINPFIVYNTGFLFSSIITGSLILFSTNINKYKNYYIKLFMTSLIAFLFSFPISIYSYYQINIFTILYNMFFVPIISFFIFPFSLVCFVIPFLGYLGSFFITIFESISLFFSNFNTNIIFAKPSLVICFIYYVLLFMLFKYKSWLINLFLLIIIFIHFNYNVIFPKEYILMIDVGQGDSILFHSAKYNILIDTGGKVYSDSSISDNTLIPLFKSLGIRKLDYLILTHGDYDHMGEAINLVDRFNVKNVILNCGTFNKLEQTLMKILNKKKILYYSCINELNINNNKLFFLNKKDYGNENDNSIVIYTELNNHKFLFMGDAGIKVEEDLLEKYNLQNIDVLKVGHHGSKTSSSEIFINGINPKYSLISVGEDNKFGHPNQEVLNNLKKSKTYRTDENGSIMFKIKNNKLQIETCTP